MAGDNISNRVQSSRHGQDGHVTSGVHGLEAHTTAHPLTIVIGHKNPDIDAIVSAIAYAELKRSMGEENVIAARCGNINERARFVLDKFGVVEPVFFSDVSPRVGDVMEQRVACAHATTPIFDVIERIRDRRFRGLPVVDDDGRCMGLISSFHISQYLFPPRSEVASMRQVMASLADICSTFQGKAVEGELARDVKRYTLMVAAMKTESFFRRVAGLKQRDVVLFVGDRENIQLHAIKEGVCALVLTGGVEGSPEVRKLARDHGVLLMSSPFDSATSVLLARSAVHSDQLLETKFTVFSPETALEEARRVMAMSNEFAFPVLDDSKRLVGILSKSDFLKPINRQLILVDHNEMTQAVHGAENVPIVEILDHHRIGTIATEAPILFINRPVGSTSTIVAMCYKQAGVPIPIPIAGLLMSGLISDTLNLTSPTATATDRQVMEELKRITGVSPAVLAEEIFSVGSPLLTMAIDEVVTADMKEYEEGDHCFTIAQIEELSFSHFQQKRNQLLEALAKRRQKEHLLFASLLVTDVNTQNSIFLVSGDEAFVKLIDYPEIEPNIWKLDGVVSRKKQLLPYLSALLARMG